MDMAETGENFYALASVPGYAADEISVAVEDCWLLISGYGHRLGQTDPIVEDVKFDETRIVGSCGEASASSSPGESATRPLTLQSGTWTEQGSESCVVRRPFCVVELGRKVDASRSIAVVANGMVAVRMAKADPGASVLNEKAQE